MIFSPFTDMCVPPPPESIREALYPLVIIPILSASPTPTPKPLVYFLSLWICLFWTFHINWIIQMANRHMKRCSISLLEKCKLKLQQGITSHQLEWLSLKRLQILNAEGGVEKREPSCPVAENVNWYSHYGRQHGDSFKNYHHMTQKSHS